MRPLSGHQIFPGCIIFERSQRSGWVLFGVIFSGDGGPCLSRSSSERPCFSWTSWYFAMRALGCSRTRLSRSLLLYGRSPLQPPGPSGYTPIASHEANTAGSTAPSPVPFLWRWRIATCHYHAACTRHFSSGRFGFISKKTYTPNRPKDEALSVVLKGGGDSFGQEILLQLYHRCRPSKAR